MFGKKKSSEARGEPGRRKGTDLMNQVRTSSVLLILQEGFEVYLTSLSICNCLLITKYFDKLFFLVHI